MLPCSLRGFCGAAGKAAAQSLREWLERVAVRVTEGGRGSSRARAAAGAGLALRPGTVASKLELESERGRERGALPRNRDNWRVAWKVPGEHSGR